MNKIKVILTTTYVAFTVFMMSISEFGFNMYLNNLGSAFLVGLMLIDIKSLLLATKRHKKLTFDFHV